MYYAFSYYCVLYCRINTYQVSLKGLQFLKTLPNNLFEEVNVFIYAPNAPHYDTELLEVGILCIYTHIHTQRPTDRQTDTFTHTHSLSLSYIRLYIYMYVCTHTHTTHTHTHTHTDLKGSQGCYSGAFDTCILLLHYKQMGRASGAFDTCILLLHYKQMGRTSGAFDTCILLLHKYI